MTSDTVRLAQALIRLPSITPNDAGCQDLLIKRLSTIGFQIKRLPSKNVDNFWAHRGQEPPIVGFSGHTDVVPPGLDKQWCCSPFEAVIKNGCLYGRGAIDMKGALAAMITATERFTAKYPNHPGTIGFLITSDEEGAATDGTIKIMDYLQSQHIHLDYCLIGEASSHQQLGDSLYIGRRGSLHGHLQVIGKQSHIAHPQANNPIHQSFKALDALTQTAWDNGNDFFNPTSFQIYNIIADTGANNVIPGVLQAKFNFRFSPESTVDTLQQRVEAILNRYALNHTIHWDHASSPFISSPGQLAQTIQSIIKDTCKIQARLSTAGGTSDGRFIVPTGTEVVELGTCNTTAHQVDEHVPVEELDCLSTLYENTLERLLKKD